MEVLDITSFAENGIIGEENFLYKLNSFDWKRYKDKPVLVKGCGSIPVPTWAFMMVAARLSSWASEINYGEIKNPVLVYKK